MDDFLREARLRRDLEDMTYYANALETTLRAEHPVHPRGLRICERCALFERRPESVFEDTQGITTTG